MTPRTSCPEINGRSECLLSGASSAIDQEIGGGHTSLPLTHGQQRCCNYFVALPILGCWGQNPPRKTGGLTPRQIKPRKPQLQVDSLPGIQDSNPILGHDWLPLKTVSAPQYPSQVVTRRDRESLCEMRGDRGLMVTTTLIWMGRVPYSGLYGVGVPHGAALGRPGCPAW